MIKNGVHLRGVCYVSACISSLCVTSKVKNMMKKGILLRINRCLNISMEDPKTKEIIGHIV
jgi:hypothetical protein